MRTGPMLGDKARTLWRAGFLVLVAVAAGCGGSSEPSDTGGGGNDVRVSDGQTDVPTGIDVADVQVGIDALDGSADAARDVVPGDVGEAGDVQQDVARTDVTDGCVSAPEVCDGMDNDCNGLIDDGLGSLTCGVGECRRTVPTCVGGVTNRCTPGTAGTETCDGLDNDCNGMVDDGLGSTTCGTGACQRTVNNCQMGTMVTCSPGRPTPETCDGVDNDCNGMVDDALGSTTCGMGACMRTVNNCVGGRAQTCMPGAPMTETCNGMDDNCDGNIDEGLGNTTCGVGACRVTQSNCVGGVMRVCTPGTPRTETCNGMDDDCNGMVDDSLSALTCGLGVCQNTVAACVAGVPQTCMPRPPAGGEVCNAMDDNCNGMVDEGDPGGGASCPTGVPGVCATGIRHCMGGSLQCVAPTPRAETCNGLDDNCDGMIDNAPIATLCPPPMPGVTTACNGAAGCGIAGGGCPAGTFDADGNATNGCECAESNTNLTCAAATNLGAFNVGDNLTLPAHALPIGADSTATPPTPGMENWYVATFNPTYTSGLHGTGVITIQLNEGMAAPFRLEIHGASCGSGILGCTTGSSSAAGVTQWQFADNNPGAGWTSRSGVGTTWPTTVYFRVYRTSAGNSCTRYTLNVNRM